jgi:hypothetical protein
VLPLRPLPPLRRDHGREKPSPPTPPETPAADTIITTPTDAAAKDPMAALNWRFLPSIRSAGPVCVEILFLRSSGKPPSGAKRCVFITAVPIIVQSCSRGGRGILEDMCYEERRRAEACVN